MRGWERVGSVLADGYVYFDVGTHVRADDLLAVSSHPSGPLRSGIAKAGDARMRPIDTYIPAAANRDIVFRARALGERAFSREN